MPDPAIQLECVSFTYPGTPAAALENVSLSVDVGQRLGILGPNGGGKSTLLKLVLGLLPIQSGRIEVFGLSPVDARQRGFVGYVPQRIDLELGMPINVRQLVTLGAAWRTHAWQSVSTEVTTRVAELLKFVGCDPFADKPIGALSGGQLQRTLIARALAANPKILVLDEPTVGIDALGQAQLAELLDSLHTRLGLTIITVSHDIRAIAASSDRVACLARRLHLHATPMGITPAVLAELFSHDIAGIQGLAGMHVHAHGPGEPCPTDSPIMPSISATTHKHKGTP